MNNDKLITLLTIMNIVELSKRTLSKSVGNDLSSRAEGIDLYDSSEALIESKLRQRLIVKVN